MRSPDVGIMGVGMTVLYSDDVVGVPSLHRTDRNTSTIPCSALTRRSYSAVGRRYSGVIQLQ